MAEIREDVRVFVSSTFRDMHAERDHLVTVVFPELRERLELLGLDFYDVDLRWGVPEIGVDGESANSWVYCKQWIDRVEPFFICMLGQRYGSKPPDKDIPESEPDVYKGLSITEMEIRHAVLDQERRKRSFFYLRRPMVPKGVSPDVYARFVESDEEDLLDGLKARIERSGRPVRPYDCRWTGTAFDELDDFGDMVLEDLWSGVLRDERYVPRKVWRDVRGRDPLEDELYTDESKPLRPEDWEPIVERAKPPRRDDFEAEAQQMRRFADSRRRWFKGRGDQLGELGKFVRREVNDEDPRMCVVAAVPGQGKSALIAEFAERLKDSGHLVRTHFVGASERSADVRFLLERLVHELDREKIPASVEEEPLLDLEGLRKRLAARLEAYKGERRIVLLIDAVNQLSSGHELTWLPFRLGPGVRVVLTCIDDPESDPDGPEARVVRAVRTRRPEPRWIDLPGLDDDDVKEIVEDYLVEYCKVLDEPEKKSIRLLEQAKNPLYLLVMLDQLRTLGGDEMHVKVREEVAGLGKTYPDTVQLFDWVLERLEVFGDENVRLWCTYLSLGRVGMASGELSELLAQELGGEQARTARLIERGIRRYLLRRGPQLDFFHGQLRQAIEERYLPKEDSGPRLEAHRAIAAYFRRKADPNGERSWDAYERGLSELPFHLTEGAGTDDARWQELHDTLTDFRFLERKAADVGVIEETDAKGKETRIYTGVFQLQDDFEHALSKMSGNGAGSRGSKRTIIVTGTDFGDGQGMKLRCPHCNNASDFEDRWKGNEITCPKCGGPLKVNEFVVERSR